MVVDGLGKVAEEVVHVPEVTAGSTLRSTILQTKNRSGRHQQG